MAIGKNLTGAGLSAGATRSIIGRVGRGIVAAGNSQGTATLLSHDVNVIETVAATTGVILPANLSAGDEIAVVNYGANALAVYPPVGGNVGTGVTNASVTVSAGQVAIFRALTPTAFGAVFSSAGASAFAPNGAITVAARGSVWFDGVDDNYTIVDSARFDFPDGDWYVAGFVQVTVLTGTRYIFSIGTQGSVQNVQLYMATNAINAQVRTAGSTTTVTSAALAAGWHVVVIQRTGTNLEIKTCPLAGSPVTSSPVALNTPGVITPSGTHTIGVRSSSQTNTWWQNNIAWVAKGTGTLSDADMTALATGQDIQTDLAKPLDVYYRLDIAAATIASQVSTDPATRVSAPLSRGGPVIAGMGVSITGAATPAWGRVYQRISGQRAITFTGGYTGAPTGIEARLIGLADAEIVGWADVTPTGAGTWSTTITVPQGLSYYTLEVRHKGAPTVYARTFYPFGVGEVMMGAGQSNFKLMATGNADSALIYDVHKVCYYNGGLGTIGYRDHRVTNLGSGVGSFLQLAQANIGADIPVMLADGSTSGSSLTATPNGWIDEAGTTYATWLSTLAAVGGDAGSIFWHQGEADGGNAVSTAAYQADLETLVARMRTAIGRSAADCPFFCWVLGHAGTTQIGSDWRQIRTAHINVLSTIPNIRTIGPAFDLDLADALHYVTSERGYFDLGRRDATAFANYFNPAAVTTGMAGPFITGATRSGSTIIITFNLNGNPAISLPIASPATIDGLRVRNGSNVLQTVNSWVIAGNQLTLTMAATPAAGWTVDYMPTELVRPDGGVPYNITDNDNMLYGTNPVLGSPRGVPVYPMTAAITLA